jgi:hypothetical protein
MKILLETKDRNEVIKWMISVLTIKYEEYTSLFKCDNKEMRDFLNDRIKETLCDHRVHLGIGFVENIGNILCNYIFCINCGEGEENGTYKIIYDGDYNDNDHFVDGWLDWSLWDEYDNCVKEACSIFASNVF